MLILKTEEVCQFSRATNHIIMTRSVKNVEPSYFINIRDVLNMSDIYTERRLHPLPQFLNDTRLSDTQQICDPIFPLEIIHKVIYWELTVGLLFFSLIFGRVILL